MPMAVGVPGDGNPQRRTVSPTRSGRKYERSRMRMRPCMSMRPCAHAATCKTVLSWHARHEIACAYRVIIHIVTIWAVESNAELMQSTVRVAERRMRTVRFGRAVLYCRLSMQSRSMKIRRTLDSHMRYQPRQENMHATNPDFMLHSIFSIHVTFRNRMFSLTAPAGPLDGRRT